MRLPALTEVRDAFVPENLDALGVDADLPVVAVVIPNVGELSRKERDDLRLLYPAKLRNRASKSSTTASGWRSHIRKQWPRSASGKAVRRERLHRPGCRRSSRRRREDRPALKGGQRFGRDGREREVYEGAGQVRLALGQKFADRHGAFNKRDFRFLWVTDFPMFEWDEEEGRWNAAHHPFTSPHEDDMDKLESDPGAVRALAYDIVLNGTELGSGSIRIHRQDIQSIIFKALGMSKEEQQARFGFFLEALQYGTPPHGGIALGLDRIVMILAGADSLREVIPFPKTAKAIDMMMDAPTPVSEQAVEGAEHRGEERQQPAISN